MNKLIILVFSISLLIITSNCKKEEAGIVEGNWNSTSSFYIKDSVIASYVAKADSTDLIWLYVYTLSPLTSKMTIIQEDNKLSGNFSYNGIEINLLSSSNISGKLVTLNWNSPIMEGECAFIGSLNAHNDSITGNYYIQGINSGTWVATRIPK